MPRMILVGSVSVLLASLSGCVNATAPERIDIGGQAAYSSAGPAPEASAAPDYRTIGDLRRENAQLRPQWTRLEQDYKARAAAVENRQAEIRQLKRDRDELKKERDRYKKASKS